MVLSLPYINHSIPLINVPFFKMCYPPRQIVTTSQLIKIDNSSIKFSGENEIVITLGYNFQYFIIQENIAPFVMFTNKLFSKFTKMLMLVFYNEFSFYSCFRKATFCIWNIFLTPNFYDLSPFLTYRPILKNFLRPCPYA